MAHVTERTAPIPSPDASVCKQKESEGRGIERHGAERKQSRKYKNYLVISVVHDTVSGADFLVDSVR